MKHIRPIIFCATLAVLVAVLGLIPTHVLGQAYSGNTYGPFDYANAEHRRRYLGIVDGNHFNADVENLVRGQTGTVFGDIRYCLRIFPNHHRALVSMAKLFRREGGIPKNADRPVPLDVMFQNAIRFSPRDPMPHMIYGVHFHKLKEYDNALMYYRNALKLDLDSAQLHYNLGLLYEQIMDYEKSLYHAKKAYDMGYQLAGLRNKLIKADVWE